MTHKLIDNKRRLHAAKVLQKMSKAPESAEHSNAEHAEAQSGKEEISLSDTLREQYEVIRNDILKLREDLSHGYDVAKNLLDRKTIMRELRRMR